MCRRAKPISSSAMIAIRAATRGNDSNFPDRAALRTLPIPSYSSPTIIERIAS
jgi:hypothetical protein